MPVEIRFTDNSDETLRNLKENELAALEACGNQAVSHAKKTITEESRVDTGKLRNSITHQVSGKDCYIGTNTSYAIFNEYGTGIYAGGRQSPWSYQDAKGDWHRTSGMPPIHFLKKAAEDHVDEYKAIIAKHLKNTT